jgi:hypothetical protein
LVEALAREYGVSHPTITAILGRRINWAGYSDEELGITDEPPAPRSGKIVRY